MSRPGLRALIAGAGLSGSLLAVYLARRGYDVEVFEGRADPRAVAGGDDRSINLGMSARGIRALRRVELWDALAPRLVPMRGRMIHRPDGTLVFQAYGSRPDEILHSIRRNELNAFLVDRAEKHAGVRFHFGRRCVSLDRDTAALTVADVLTGERRTHRGDFVVGADGAFSTVRRRMHHGLPVDFQQTFIDWGYKELTIPPHADGSARTPIEALHLWPSDNGLVVGHPNIDNSITCTLLLPLAAERGTPSFATLPDSAAATAYARATFPDLPGLIPDFAAQYDAHPVAHLVTVRTGAWHHRDRVVLVGDACHAVTPFYGQGMNSAFEDCLVLDECLSRHPDDRAAAFALFQALRRPHTDVLADLSMRNFVELRDRVRSPLHLARARADLLLNRMFPRLWRPLYAMVSHSTVPYGDALRRARRQDAVLAVTATAALTGAAWATAGFARRRSFRGNR
ncbi:kynurenine 3-monooxygenase [Virgisporangium aliadipatigenens]|uniref:Kynurenine 3-monooxygenase n=1 Tax=Virgisporangium aliadipatigenens TaxID=741659 RepID=A0A8J4DP93_9ACTN|nr:NAD(P)/FAD-dependent oxidoreductase [Virgisporangium aliadipatigenens]GIJ45279.1 kynurenine 3-monooxygenase [Virgisporangium aliadipatigenens]